MRARPQLGVCQWFHYLDYECVERSVELMHELGVRHLRTGISWADYHRPAGKQWYDWQMEQLADFDVLLSVWHTPPSISEGGTCNSPPRRLQDYADFIGQLCRQYGDYFTDLELWNEPNNWFKWNFRDHDPRWHKFARMLAMAAARARCHGKTAVLGGIIPVDAQWLDLMHRYDALINVEVIAIHAFPEMWWPDHYNWDWHRDWHGWQAKVETIAAQCAGRPVWVTETGLATWDPHHRRLARGDLQVRMLEQASRAPVQRLYWYSLLDLDPEREALDGFHVDENHYHMGLVGWDGTRKDAFFRLQELLLDAEPAVTAAQASAAVVQARHK
ncbi:MAG TPA: hypothetical protein VEC57_13170 [Candidatus Limnocylindrales bacterium]|nr:hypothetical protein [Candidatus Limnocylindrales bacterium]